MKHYFLKIGLETGLKSIDLEAKNLEIAKVR